MDHGMPEALFTLVQTADQSRARTGHIQVKNKLQLVTINSPKHSANANCFQMAKFILQTIEFTGLLETRGANSFSVEHLPSPGYQH